ncbi:b-box zinc finger domain-containing protein [Cystoisospora suis]|uniref:B-box zinc finger domain-containing protein n=1 Tax=Cystoisospora suis TaxID=483139 RepID=A0A2C6L4U8_9APIC|nr:b-box zinc finger domain-containing protein [Cystoisospora suis]
MKVLCFPEDAEHHIAVSKKREAAVADAVEYLPSSKDAAPNIQLMPPQIREILSRAEAEDEADKGLPVLMNILNPRQRIPSEVCQRLWGLLSDNDFLPLLTLLKAADNGRRPRLVAAACNLANLFSAVPDLARHLFRYELEWTGHLPASLLLHTSSLLFPFLSYLCSSRELLLPGDMAWLNQVMGPVIAAAENTVRSEGITTEKLLNDPPVRILRPAASLLLERLQALSFRDLPHTLRGLLYLLTDAVDGQIFMATGSPQTGGSPTGPAIAVCAEALLTCAICEYLLHDAPRRVVKPSERSYAPVAERESSRHPGSGPPGRSIRRPEDPRESIPVLSDGSTNAAGVRRLLDTVHRYRVPPIYDSLDKLVRQIAQFCWDPVNRRRGGPPTVHAEGHVPEVTATRNSEEKFLVEAGQQVVDWVANQLRLPRLRSPLKFSSGTLRSAAERGASEIMQYVLQIDRELREGTFQSGTPGISNRDIATPAYEQILEFSIKAGAYDEISGRLHPT